MMKQRKEEDNEVEAQENSLPLGWEWVKLVDVVKFNPPKENLLKFTESTKVSFVPMAAVDGDLGTISKPQERKLGEVKKGYTSFRNSDVLFAKITPCMENGKAAIAHNLKNGLGFGSTEFHVLRPYGGVSSEYLFHFVRQEIFRNEARRSMTGTAGQLRVPQSFMADVSLPLPPLEEEKRIIEKLTQLLKRVANAKSSIDEVPETLKQFRQAVLSAACSGKLVEQDPNDEPATVLLERIRTERKKKWLDELIAKGKDPKEFTYKEPVEPEISELPELPEGWMWVHLPELGSMSRGMSKHRPRNEKKLYGGKYPFIQTGDIRNSPDIILKYSQTYNEEGLKQSKLWPKNTLAITIAANIAETAILGLSACFPDSVVGLIADENLCDIHYVHHFIRTIKSRLSNFASATAQKNLNIRTLNKVAVALPPLNEQKRIVAKVKELFTFADTIDASVTKAQANAERIKQALLAKAFRGELVEQDPNDEPASVLLRRIKEDRSASVKAKS